MRVDGKTSTQTNTTNTIHNVIILDGSGSMTGSKYNSAVQGIQLDLATCKLENFATYTFVEFNDYQNITTHCLMSPLNTVKLKFNGANGQTPLYQTIGETLEHIQKLVSKGDKVLVKIFTDGGENASQGKFDNTTVLSNLIQQCEKEGFTITFIGTALDVTNIVQRLKIDKSNTLVHKNTGDSVKEAFTVQANQTRSYSKRVAAGEDVTLGFYSKTIVNEQN